MKKHETRKGAKLTSARNARPKGETRMKEHPKHWHIDQTHQGDWGVEIIQCVYNDECERHARIHGPRKLCYLSLEAAREAKQPDIFI
jgi:hypothetical protein